MNKFTVAAIAVILVMFGGLIAWTSFQKANNPTDVTDYNSASIIKADDNNGNIGDHVRGNENAKVIVVEYADLQCPGCAAAMPNVHELYEEYGDRVAFLYRNFPIQGHQNARAAAAAAESAGFQGYYWDMVETIYSNRAEWISETGTARTEVFVSLFKDIAPEGDVDKFREDMGSSNIETKINFDYSLGKNVDKVSATPAFYVNGVAINVEDAETQEDLKKLLEDRINEELKKAGEETGAKSNE